MKPFSIKYLITDTKQSLQDIYNTREENAKGRLCSLLSSIITAFYNAFITGIFYTGFLSMYGISITGVGIVSFIPLFANIFCIFSPTILRHFKKRKGILIASKIYFYAMYILATTLMPLFVKDTQARLICFCVILFLAYSVYALFSSGFTTWFYHFYPADNEKRTRYLTYNQIFSSIVSSVILVLGAVVTDAVSGSPKQNQVILIMRYVAFLLVLIDVFVQSRAAEPENIETKPVSIRDVFTLPFKYRKFLLCLLFMFLWNYISQLVAGTWSYHLLNHMHFSYTLINVLNLFYTVMLLILSPFWRKVLRRYSWVKTFGIASLLWIPTEYLFFTMSLESTYLFVPLMIWQYFCSIGLNLSYSNILYMNIPEDNTTAHIAFYNVGANLFAFLGMVTGTYLASISGDSTIIFLGREIYSVQFGCLMRLIGYCIVAYICLTKWRSLSSEEEIRRIEDDYRMMK